MNKIIMAAFVICFLSSCAHGTDINQCIQAVDKYGFWGGLWHGCIAPFDLIAMIWSDKIVVYAPNNNGGWYAFGFCLGGGLIFGGSSKAASKK